MDQPNSNILETYYNSPQLRSILIDAPNDYNVMGRGLGKTSGILAYKTLRNLKYMPRACGAIVQSTYQASMTRVLPSLIAGWERLNFIQDVDYVIGKKPPLKWKWISPFEPPKKCDYFLWTAWGSGMYFISQDMKGSSNGLNLAWVAGDEAKYLDYQQYLDETFPTLRAEHNRYGELPFHCSQLFVTSMPTAADAKWILKMEDQVDLEKKALLDNILFEVLELRNAFPSAPKYKKKAISRRLSILEEMANNIRRAIRNDDGEIIEDGFTFYQEASSIENVAVLGDAYIAKMRRTMPDFIFNAEILNIRPDTIDGCFYPDLRIEDVKQGGHTYVGFNNPYIESLNYNFQRIGNVNCSMDADCNTNQPLRIAIDWGAKINSMSITQPHPEENALYFINELFVTGDEFLDHLAMDFINYYAPHHKKEVLIIPGHDGNNEQANSNMTYIEQFSAILRKHKWTVIVVERRKAPTHAEKYYLNHIILSEADPKVPKVRFNRDKCKYTINSMLNAPVYQDGTGRIRKNKASERNENIEPEDATHLSDTFDMQVEYAFGNQLHTYEDFQDNIS